MTSTLTHLDASQLVVNMYGLWLQRPLFISIYGLPAFVIVWLGAGLAGGLACIRDRKKKERQYVIYNGIGASGSILWLTTAIACAMPQEVVYAMLPLPLPISISMPMGVFAGGFAAYSIAAIQNRWQPNMGHWRHARGMAFGAFCWILASVGGKLAPHVYSIMS